MIDFAKVQRLTGVKFEPCCIETLQGMEQSSRCLSVIPEAIGLTRFLEWWGNTTDPAAGIAWIIQVSQSPQKNLAGSDAEKALSALQKVATQVMVRRATLELVMHQRNRDLRLFWGTLKRMLERKRRAQVEMETLSEIAMARIYSLRAQGRVC